MERPSGEPVGAGDRGELGQGAPWQAEHFCPYSRGILFSLERRGCAVDHLPLPPLPTKKNK